MKETLSSIAIPTLRRLPLYLKIAVREKGEGQSQISSSKIARECNLDPILVRKDIASTGVVGQARCGFDINNLIESVEVALGWRNENEAFLVGAGYLGTALLRYKKFQEFGLKILAAFDVDQAKIGKKIDGIAVFSLSKFENLTKRMRPSIGIITVDADVAQDVADIMVAHGIQAIWNFCPISLKVPASIIVENVSLSASLGVLTSKLKQQGVDHG